jgi:hypothetical protein
MTSTTHHDSRTVTEGGYPYGALRESYTGSNTPSRTVIASSKDYPYGAVGESYTGSTNGFPPLLNPAIGKLFLPSEGDNYQVYPALAYKLSKAIDAAIPEGTGPILDITLRTASHAVIVAYNSLSCDAFVLGEVDPEHPLLKIATLTDFDEFCAAFSGLDV